MARLNEFDEQEWREVVRKVRPDWTDEQFDRAWREFVRMKHQKSLN